MKKLFLAICVTASLASCSSDDSGSNANNTEGSHIKKAVYTDPNGAVSSSEYFYTGNHLTKVVSGSGSQILLGYSGDLLVQASSGSGSADAFEYNAQGKLAHFFNAYRSAVYVYNTDGTVTVTNYEGQEIADNIKSVSTLYFENGELVKKVSTNPDEPDTITYTFTYDLQNNPNLNKTGYYGAYFYDSWGPYVIGKAHNLLGVACESTGGPQYGYSYTYLYEYNSQGYPTKQTQIDANGNATSGFTNYFYE